MVGLLGKVSRLYPPNKGRLWPPVRFEPRTHRLRGWIINFPTQVPRRLLDYPEPMVGLHTLHPPDESYLAKAY